MIFADLLRILPCVGDSLPALRADSVHGFEFGEAFFETCL